MLLIRSSANAILALALSGGWMLMGQSLTSGLPPTRLDPGAAPSAQVEDPSGAFVNASSADALVNASVEDQAAVALAQSPAAVHAQGFAGSIRRSHSRRPMDVRGVQIKKVEHRLPLGSHILSSRIQATGWTSGIPSAPKAANSLHIPDAAKTQTALGQAVAGASPRGAVAAGNYSNGFQDSTRGTALVSPPDPGTAGPFGFSPGISMGLLDFSNRQFLSPGLKVGGHAGKRTRDGRWAVSKPGQPTKANPPGAPLSTSPSDDLGVNMPSDTSGGNGLNSDLGSHLDTSVPTN